MMATVTSGRSRLRLVTLNTWKGEGAYSARLTEMAAGLVALAPDIVALQEVFAAPKAGHHTAAHLAQALDMTATALPLRHKSRKVDGHAVESTSGLAVLSRLPVRSQRAVMFTGDHRDGDRAALIVDLDIDGQTTTVACLHLTHLEDADRLRRQQWREAEAALSGCANVLVAGDFNAPIEVFDLAGGRLADSRQACGEPARSTVIDGPPQCIDHVLFASAGAWRPTRWATALAEPGPRTGVTASDHLAVVVDFTAA